MCYNNIKTFYMCYYLPTVGFFMLQNYGVHFIDWEIKV